MVKDIFPPHEGSLPGYLGRRGGYGVSGRRRRHSGPELWKSDGTAGGTVQVRDIIPGAGGAYPGDLTDVNGTLFLYDRLWPLEE
jgi:ELWxxDGT repeat protein